MMTERTIPVLKKSGDWVPEAEQTLAGIMHYPECVQSMMHFVHVHSNDEQKCPGERSQIGSLIQNDVTGRKRQGYATGQVALRLIEMSVHGPQPSVNKAVHLTVLEAGKSIVDGKRFTPKTTSAVRKGISLFKNVGHLWAAQVQFTDLFLQAAKDKTALAQFLAVAAIFEERLEEIYSPSGWNPHRVPNKFRGTTTVKVPPLSDERREWLEYYHPELR